MASSSVLRTNRPGNRLPEDDLCQLRLLPPDMRLTWVDHPKMRINLTIQKWWLQRFYQKETRYGKITTEPQEWGLDNFSEQYGFHVKFCRVCISVHQCLDHHDPAIPQSCNRMIFFLTCLCLTLLCQHMPVSIPQSLGHLSLCQDAKRAACRITTRAIPVFDSKGWRMCTQFPKRTMVKDKMQPTNPNAHTDVEKHREENLT